jgi:Protein of unknown function (DUF3099)
VAMNLMRKRSGDAEVFRITGTAAGLSDDVRGRQRRYVISMTIRTICVVLAFTLWNVSQPLAWAALVGGALLPYIAVVIANAGRENAKRLPTGRVSLTHRRQLEARGHRPPQDDPR